MVSKKLEQILDKYEHNRSRPKQFNDPLATEIDWNPTNQGGASFCSHKLKRRLIFPGTIGFKVTLRYRLFCGFVLMMGLVNLVGTPVVMARAKASWPEYIIPVILGLGFSSLGIWLSASGTKPRTFDRTSGLYWSGCRQPQNISRYDNAPQPRSESVSARLDNIYALQILSEWCGTTLNQQYLSYELNLVLKDGTRLNVVDHGNLRRLRKDSQALAEFLGVPVWDITMPAETVS
jgi:hypothetical protein